MDPNDNAGSEPPATRPGERRARKRPGTPCRSGGPRRVGPYRVEAELGRGGMGVVYRAFDERLHRSVALKSLPEDLAGDTDAMARLELEARSLASVSHGNVATIHGLEVGDGGTFLVLELIVGETLQALLARGALGVERACELCAQVAAGLHAVHRKGLVHRDLKSSNVMVTPDGEAKLLDFGLARRARAGAAPGASREEEIAGTSGWMSPEQLRGEELDARSDAWAWGCLLYECLAGGPAFPGATWADRDAATLLRDPDWDGLPGDTPEAVRALLESCLSRDRDQRPGSLDEARRLLATDSVSSRRTARAARHSLPAEHDEFVGRERDLAELGERLARGTRLVSVLGLGGTGKTRLAVRLARERLADWPGGAWFCDLSEARSADGITGAVARVLEVSLAAGDAVSLLGAALADRGRCLVILDNFEQVSRHARATLGAWMDAAPDAQFLVTTREVLGLAGEEAFALAPLVEEDAVELFCRRASAARRDFAPDGGEREVIAQLVDELDMLPLAIEIAAARVTMMSPRKILERTTDRFRLLTTSGARRDRQATLRATLDWSWDLLSDDERSALAQLSVFEGGFTLEAAEAVLELDSLWPTDAVQALMNKSLVRRSDDDRFDLLVSVQEYAAERLAAAGGRDAAEERHGAHFTERASLQAIAALDRMDGGEHRRLLARELDNLVAACRRAAERGDGRSAVAILRLAGRLFALSGPAATGHALAESVLAVDGLDPTDRANALEVAEQHLEVLGRMDEALARAQEKLALLRSLGDPGREAVAMDRMATLLREIGRPEEACALHEQAVERLPEGAPPAQRGGLLCNYGNALRAVGRRDEARVAYERALVLVVQAGHRRFEASVIGCLGILAEGEGRLDEALERFTRVAEIGEELGDRRSRGLSCMHLGATLHALGRRDEALARCEQALSLLEDVGASRLAASLKRQLASLLLESGRLEEARAHAEAALQGLDDQADPRREAMLHCTLGDIESEAGDPKAAVTHYERVLAVEDEHEYPEARAGALRGLARLHAAGGRDGQARSCLDQAEAAVREAGTPEHLGQILAARGAHAARTGDVERARADLAECEELARRLGVGEASPLAIAAAALRRALRDAPPGA